MEIELRDAKELQETHDRLLAILLNKVHYPWDDVAPDTRDLFTAAVSVLCWVLKHEEQPVWCLANLPTMANARFSDVAKYLEAHYISRGLRVC
jgi:hypothetical protein